MMEYRKLPHGSEQERFSTLGIGLGGIQKASDKEIEATVVRAIEGGVNYFDACGGAANIYAPFGQAIRGAREKVFFQLHLGAVYNAEGEYGWSRDLDEIKRTLDWELRTLGTDYIDMGFLHCVDQKEDYQKLIDAGVYDYLVELKKQGVVRHMCFSSHTPSVANAILDSGAIDLMMFSVNPAYDFDASAAEDIIGDENGGVSERAELYRRCQAEGVGISVMKPFHAGKLLTDEASPFKRAMTRFQCLQYVLDRPGVLVALPGVRGLEDLEALLPFAEATPEERDYSFIGALNAESARGSCVYCNHCQPCPAGLDIGLINKYYDLARMGDVLARDHYRKLTLKAEDCLHCGHCDSRCPFAVPQSERMAEIAGYFAR